MGDFLEDMKFKKGLKKKAARTDTWIGLIMAFYVVCIAFAVYFAVNLLSNPEKIGEWFGELKSGYEQTEQTEGSTESDNLQQHDEGK